MEITNILNRSKIKNAYAHSPKYTLSPPLAPNQMFNHQQPSKVMDDLSISFKQTFVSPLQQKHSDPHLFVYSNEMKSPSHDLEQLHKSQCDIYYDSDEKEKEFGGGLWKKLSEK